MPITLNDDVLHLILRNCPSSTLSVVSRLSSHARILALSHLLYTVSLRRSPHQIFNFLTFIHNHTLDSESPIKNPGKFVHTLEVYTPYAMRETTRLEECAPIRNEEYEKYPMSAWVPMLTQALKRMPNLRSFIVQGEAEDVIFYSPDIGIVLMALAQLTSLSMWGIGPSMAHALGMAVNKDAVRLKAFHIHRTSTSDEENPPLVRGEGVGRQLFHHSSQLTELSLTSFDLTELLQEDEILLNGTKIVFPHVGTLRLSGCFLSLKALATSFPSIRTLILGSAGFLRSHLEGPPQDYVSFPRLVSVEGWFKYINALVNVNTCRDRVRRAVVTYDWSDENSGIGSNIAPFSLPAAASPYLRSLHLSRKWIRPLSWWQKLAETFGQLSYLNISVDSRSKEDWDLILKDLPSTLSSTPLDYLSLLIQDHCEHVSGSPIFTKKHVALSYARQILTLKFINVQLRTDHDLHLSPMTWWRSCREVTLDGDVMTTVESLEPERGRIVHDWYDLHAYHRNNT